MTGKDIEKIYSYSYYRWWNYIDKFRIHYRKPYYDKDDKS